jgi:hypothetical protein
LGAVPAIIKRNASLPSHLLKKTFKRRSQAQAAPQNEACLHGQNVHGRQPRAQLGNLFVKQPMIVFNLPHQIMCSSSRCGKRSQRTACSLPGTTTRASLITIFITSHEVPLGVHAPYLTPHDSRTKAALTKEFFFFKNTLYFSKREPNKEF